MNLGVKQSSTPHFVPEVISSSMRGFIILVLILKFFMFIFLKNKEPQKKKFSCKYDCHECKFFFSRMCLLPRLWITLIIYAYYRY